MLPDTLIEERELLAEVKSKPEWADLPIVKIVATEGINRFDDPIWRIHLLYSGPLYGGLTVEDLGKWSRREDQDDKFIVWNKLNEVSAYIASWFRNRYTDSRAMVDLVHEPTASNQ